MLLDQNERTARMNHQHPRRILTPGASRLKRKEREQPFYPTKPSPLAPVFPPAPPPLPAASQQTPRATVTTATTMTTSKGSKVGGEEPMSSNQLLAGYMAYEFLTKGTLLGQKFDPARAEAVPVSGGRLKSNINISSRSKSSVEAAAVGKNGGDGNGSRKTKKQSESYMEVASLVMRKNEGGGGAHVPGVVNPTQLARWIQM